VSLASTDATPRLLACVWRANTSSELDVLASVRRRALLPAASARAV